VEGNDIGVTYVARYAVRFEGLLMSLKEPDDDGPKDGFIRRLRKKTGPAATPLKASSMWVPNVMPMKSLLDFTTRLHLQVEVVTYMGEWLEDEIERWLARKGAFVQVYSYDSVLDWAEDLRRNPEIRAYYTPDEEERDIIGWQHCTVVRPSQTWGV